VSAPLVETTEEFLAISALRTRSSAEILDEFCRRAIAGGVPIARAYLGWRLLHPLFMSHNLIFEASTGVSVERFRHTEGERSEAYQRSPLKHVLENDLSVFRRRLVDPDCPRDFPVLDEFAGRGYTDYVIFLVDFGAEVTDAPGSGVIMTFASHGPDGFTPEHMALLERLKFMLALSTRIEIETEMRQTLARTYLGRSAAEKVLSGQIRRGEGRAIEAVVWYCDLRGSTHLCEAMGVDAYLPLLNDYFSVTAGPVTDRGGEVLDFIGDAVLAIFSLDAGGLDAAMEATSAVVEALESFRQRHSDALGGRDTVADVAGIAIDIGTVIYGNIGAPDRLTFSVIGPTVNKVARIERLTKTLHEPVLVTAPVAAACRGSFSTLGMFELDGVSAMEELFALDAACTAPRAALAEAVEPALASR
jgi:adenylate cyclase